MIRPFIQGICWGAILIFLDAAVAAPARHRIESFRFAEPAAQTYHLLIPVDGKDQPIAFDWIQVAPANATLTDQAFGRRIVLGLTPGTDMNQIPVAVAIQRRFDRDTWILKAADARAAALEAQRLATLDGVRLCHPEMRFKRRTSSPYAPRPNDERYLNQWYLDARDDDGNVVAAAVNAREAWAISRGEGVLIAIGDDGMEINHPDLVAATTGQPHFNFENSTSNPAHSSDSEHHGTSVAGLAAARGNNGIGIAGTAPQSLLAGWKMLFASTVSVADMFQYESNRVSVQNHSWSFGQKIQVEMPEIEKRGITNSVTHGRDGKGAVLVRASGNNRFENPSDLGNFPAIAITGDANDDGYIHDPHTIAVAAVRTSGRVASYSTPGACVLVAAGSGDTGYPSLFTTDRAGDKGRNRINCLTFTNCWDYIFDDLGFIGTSGSSPIVAGVTALMLGANTNLTYRDVQQILALSARHKDLADSDIQTNAAGLRISHNVGYGIVDAGEATRLSLLWTNRPPRQEFRYVKEFTGPVPIPDFGNIVHAEGTDVPSHLGRVQGFFPVLSQHPDDIPGEWRPPNLETHSLPLTFVGLAEQDITEDLTGRAALIERGQVDFIDKLDRAKTAGAEFAIVFNKAKADETDPHDPEDLISMGLQSVNTYPAIFIGRTNGLALRDQAANNTALRVQLVREGPRFTFTVTNNLICEHVAVRLRTDHSRRRDLHINLYSPSGTRSRLARPLIGSNTPFVNFFEEAGPSDWNYYSVIHFFEPTAGEWIVQVVDEQEGETGNILGVELLVTGTPITDTDRDGLDDQWESTHFGNLNQGPRDDPDRDGYQNAKEQAIGTHPNLVDPPFTLNPDLSLWSDRLARFSWPGSTNFTYTLEATDTATGTFSAITNVTATFPVTEAFHPYTNTPNRFFRVRSTPLVQ